jgi:hypothetical protein
VPPSAEPGKSGAAAHFFTSEASSATQKKTARSQANTAGKDSKLEKFFVEELKDIYWAEQKLVKTLPKLEKRPRLKS